MRDESQKQLSIANPFAGQMGTSGDDIQVQLTIRDQRTADASGRTPRRPTMPYVNEREGSRLTDEAKSLSRSGVGATAKVRLDGQQQGRARARIERGCCAVVQSVLVPRQKKRPSGPCELKGLAA